MVVNSQRRTCCDDADLDAWPERFQRDVITGRFRFQQVAHAHQRLGESLFGPCLGNNRGGRALWPFRVTVPAWPVWDLSKRVLVDMWQAL